MEYNHVNTLLIDDGGVASLIAGYLQPAESVTHVWFSWTHGPSLNSRHAASQHHATLLRATWSQSNCLFPPDETLGPQAGGLGLSRMLLAAGQTALERGCDRLIWPVLGSDDIEQMSRAVDRARLIEHTWTLDLTGDEPSLLLDLPLIDLSTPQLADLASDLEIPLSACWDCLAGANQRCGECSSCRDVEDIYAGRGIIEVRDANPTLREPQ